MRNLSMQEQKLIVGGKYYYKIYSNSGKYMNVKSELYADLEQCVADCGNDVFHNWGYDYCGRVYDNNTGKIVRYI